MASQPSSRQGSAQNTPSNTPIPAEKIVNHMFECESPHVNSSGETVLRPQDAGYVVDYQPTLQEVRVVVQNRGPEYTVVAKLKCIRIYALRRADRILPVEIVGNEKPTLKVSLSQLGPTQSFGGRQDIRTHFSALISGIMEMQANQKLLPEFKAEILHWVSDKNKVRETCTMLRDVMRPEVVKVLTRPDFTLREVIDAGQVIEDKNHTAGVYLRLYSDFKSGNWAGKAPFLYVGQTGDMWRRNSDHDSAINNPAKDQAYHYQLAQAATRSIKVQISRDKNTEGGNAKRAQGLRTILEQLMVLMLRTYSDRQLNWRRDYGQKSVDQAIAENFETRNHCNIFMTVSTQAMELSDFPYPGRPFRPKPFGTDGGCNGSSPWTENMDSWEKVQWTVQELQDRWVLQRSSLRADVAARMFVIRLYQDNKRKEVCHIDLPLSGTVHGGSRSDWKLVPGADHPQVGDDVYPI
ncbi:uncharacterized protein LTR77_007546 [Saxophila tyrrhenica]|uniref:Uncharacterized protein n=1 Tax=Saxophila tyrrhenica TaxID=1690608 RepID=A0AAV9P2C6_9PEZI|nr:hypothetical protein LTR77_007546 [Saxophila tyrrhenica]